MPRKKKSAEQSEEKPKGPRGVKPPQEEPKHALKILGLQAENFKALKVVRIRPKSNVISVGGDNGSGKSSLLDAIEVALCGTKNMPTSPVRKGAKSGRIQVDLGDYKVTRLFQETSNKNVLTKLQIEGKDRERFATPQALLDSLMGDISFDPLEFTRMKPEKQVETLRRLAKLDVDIDELDAMQKADYDQRRELGRQIDALKARIAAIPEMADVPDQPIDLAALTEKIGSATTTNENIGKQEQVIAQWELDERRLLARVAESNSRIAQLEEQLTQLRRQIEADEFTAGDLKGKMGYAKEQLPARIDTAPLVAELTAANETNAKVQRKLARKKLESEQTETETQWNALDLAMKVRATARTVAIEKAKMPLDGLSFGDGEVLWQGIPLDQASTSEKIRVSVALGMASNPTLRVLRIKDGSLLDDKSLALVEKMAADNDYQMWIELVDRSGKVSVVMEAGEASGEEVERV